MIRVFIGYDSKETVAYHVLAHSILRHASVPVSVTPLKLSQLPLTRSRTPTQSTEFSFSRFLVPWLCGFQGLAIYMDCDMLCRADITGLALPLGFDVAVVKHDYRTKHATKFLGSKNEDYPRKNWSSLMVMDCGTYPCRQLTPDYVNKAAGSDLHRFAFLRDERIASLPPEWNHLVGEYDPNPDAKMVHFTLGTPCFSEYAECEFSQEWRDEKNRMLGYRSDLSERAAA